MKKDTSVYVVIEHWDNNTRIAGIFKDSDDANDMLIQCRKTFADVPAFEWADIEEHYVD